MSPEISQTLRYGLVGGTVAAIYIVLYSVLLKLGWPSAVANASSFGLAIILQYMGHSRWTYRQPMSDPKQIARFIVSTALGFAASMIITSIGTHVFDLPGWMAATLVAVWVPVQNYILFSAWVYARPRMERT